METTADLLRLEIKRVLFGQLVVTLIISSLAFFYQNLDISMSALFGGVIAMVLSWWLGVGAKRFENSNDNGQTTQLALLMFGFIQRLLIVLALFWVGLGIWDLDPLAMTVAFGLAYTVYWVELYRMGRQ